MVPQLGAEELRLGKLNREGARALLGEDGPNKTPLFTIIQFSIFKALNFLHNNVLFLRL